MTGPLTRAIIAPIRLYRRLISPGLPPRCRYAPTCSAYAVEALEVHGPVKGLVLAAWRLLRCNPWSAGGVDRVPARGRWRPDPWVPPEDWAGLDEDLERPVPMGLDGSPIDEGGAALGPAELPASAGRPADATRVHNC
jgi:putative membrane protein insertion efficiency factor